MIAAIMSKPPTAAPTPMPAFAPVERPVLAMVPDVGEDVAGVAVGLLVLGGDAMGDAVGEVLELAEVLMVGKSCWRYSTHIGCAHIESGPVTVVILGAVLFARAATAVEPEAIGYELIQPSKMTELDPK